MSTTAARLQPGGASPPHVLADATHVTSPSNQESPTMPTLNNAHALVIGIADYANIRKLPKVRDAEDLAAVLVDPALCGYDPKNVTVLLDRGRHREKIRAGLERAQGALRRRLDRLPLLLGARRAGPGGGEPGAVPAARRCGLPGGRRPGPDGDLGDGVHRGPQRDQGQAADGRARLLPCRGDRRASRPGTAEQVETGLSDGYLNELKSGTGRVIISATRGTDPAYVREGAKYGVFTGHFLDGLRGAARGDGGVIRILDLYSYVQEKVVADQPNQRPVLKVELEENYPIVLYRGGKPPATEPVERPDDGFKYDVFLSYRGQDPDKTWVRKTLYPRLKAEGLKVCLDAVDFRLGEPVIHEMERAVTESRYTMAVLTPLNSRATSPTSRT